MSFHFRARATRGFALSAWTVLGSIAATAQQFPSPTNLPPTPIVTNRAPLVAAPFVALPLGSVRPQGWLLTQCQLQRNGITGNAETIYADDLGTNSAWLGGTGENFERGPYYFKGLIALAYTLNDAGLKQTAQKWMNWLLENQGANGYIGPVANNDWWPRMPATYALRDYYEATADPRVPVVLSNYFNYMRLTLPARPLSDWSKSRAGDEMDVALWLYNRNGGTNLLSLVNLLHQQAYDWTTIFANDQFDFFGADIYPKHNVNVEQALKMPAVYYQVSQQTNDFNAVSIGIANLMRENALSFGINSGTEFLAGDSSIQGVELCAIVEAMLSLETDVRITGDPTLADRLETLAFNALPAALANDIKGLQYYTVPNNLIAIPGGHGFNQDYSNATLPGPDSGFPCCRYNFQMGWPKFVQNSWAATPDGGLAVIAYAPTVVNAIAGGTQVQISEGTSYPFAEQVSLSVSVSNTVTFPLSLRIPAWCSNATITVNGQPQAGVQAGTFYRLARTWTNGDTVTINLPMPIQTTPGPSRAVAINRGPVVYSLQIGESWTTNTPDPLGLGFDEFQVHATTPWAYALALNPTNPAASLTYTNFATPTNPFDPAEPSVELKAEARAVANWTIGWDGTQAFEPPVSPVASTNPLVPVTLVPFGSQHLRLSWFPYLGTPSPVASSFSESFDPTWCQRWTTFGGNWTVSNGVLSTVPASAYGAKALAMATAFTNFTYAADVSVGSEGNAGVIFRASQPDIGADAYCGYYAGIDAQDSNLQFGYASNGWHSITNVSLPIASNTFYHLQIQATGTRLRIYLGNTNQPLLDLQDATFASGMVGVRDYCTDSGNSLSSFANLAATETQPLAAWFAADTITNLGNGIAVSNWPDASGNGFNATQAAAAQRPVFVTGALNGLPVVRFNATNNTSLAFNRPVQDDFTIFCVFRSTQGLSSGYLYYQGAGLVNGHVSGGGPDFGTCLFANGQVCAGTGDPAVGVNSLPGFNNGKPHVMTFKRTESVGETQLYLDGGIVAATTGTTNSLTAPSQLDLGAVLSGGGFFSGDIAEVKIYAAALSDSDRSAQETGLINKWGVGEIPQPTLSATFVSANQVSINWQAVANNNAGLYFATNLTAPVAWFAVTNPVTTNQGQCTVTLPINSGTRFFRLSSP